MLLEPDGPSLQPDHLVALPRLVGPRLGGLPHDGDGFIEVDDHGRVEGLDSVWAAGDCTTFPIKQGGDSGTAGRRCSGGDRRKGRRGRRARAVSTGDARNAAHRPRTHVAARVDR